MKFLESRVINECFPKRATGQNFPLLWLVLDATKIIIEILVKDLNNVSETKYSSKALDVTDNSEPLTMTWEKLLWKTSQSPKQILAQ